MTTTFSNTDDVIDSRDVIARLQELRDEHDALEEAIDEWNEENSENVIELEDKIKSLKDEQEAVEDAIDTLNTLNDSESVKTEREDWQSKLETIQEKLEEAEVALEELQEELETLQEELADWDDEEGAELEILEELDSEASGCGDWAYGETLIHESHFEDYCRELVDDLGELPKGLPSYIVIDWEATAENLKHDYTEVDFDGETYYLRS